MSWKPDMFNVALSVLANYDLSMNRNELVIRVRSPLPPPSPA